MCFHNDSLNKYDLELILLTSYCFFVTANQELQDSIWNRVNVADNSKAEGDAGNLIDETNAELQRYDAQFYKDNYFEYEQGTAEPIVKGRLKNSIEFWRRINAPEFVLDIIQHGYKLPFLESPPRAYFPNNKSALSNKNFVADAVLELLDKGLITECSDIPHVVNPLTVAKQSSGKLRLILDLRFVNKYLWKDKVQFEDWNTALTYFQKDDFLFSFDLKSGYHHFHIFSEHTTFLSFGWDFGFGTRYFSFQNLPFGLSTAPYVFTKCLRPLVHHWRSNGIFMVIFLDDGWGRAHNREVCEQNASQVKSDLLEAGFVPNKDKSQWEPVQSLIWLGLSWSSTDASICITERRINDIIDSIELLQAFLPTVSARKLASIAGKIISAYPVMGAITQLKTRYMYQEVVRREHWDKVYNLCHDSKVFEELFFWKSEIRNLNKCLLFAYSIPQVVAFTDASETGTGAWAHGKLQFYRNWTVEESSRSSTWRELEGLSLALQAFAPNLSGKKVKMFTDNKGVVSIIRKGSMNIELHNMSVQVYDFCKSNAISLEVQWIPRSENQRADALSREIDTDDWGVSKEFFGFMDGIWGPHSVDRFATDYNAKLPRFNSKVWCPGTSGVDAFTMDWYSENNWLVPPVGLIGQVLRHVKACSASGTLVFPEWPSAPFWPLLFSPHSNFRILVKNVIRISDPSFVFVQGRNRNSIFGTNKFRSSVICVRLAAP